MTRIQTIAISLLTVAALAAGQIPGLNAGTVTANVGGESFSANVSIATLDKNGKLVLSSLSNQIQIQVEKAKVGKFEIKLDEDGGLMGVLVALKIGKRYVSPVSGSITIESLTNTSAAGRFEFEGKDLETEASVKVSQGRFQVKFTGK